ncbi:precorrin-3B synthase [Mycobacterium sp. 236(2023)]|uniref:precorrin-3B synthase n=1 Tax=Mycobacterium sp. 236(2023) TaxID=3038163 RepID=UPI002414DE08|nr:precorrin-3B synthase [Mycobacterium sp. 236(2023)]MDG4666588.1 precorrin-3B synthase [Mycobacterium sp. 236(2023)]
MARLRDDDACPGALQTHSAADGELARLRLPGGVMTAHQMESIALAAIDFAASTLELTSRGNVQIRGVRDPAAVADILSAEGLLPSPSHERVRNIVASPLSGRSGGLCDTRELVADLDARLRQDPLLARLPGRFLFGIDDGRGDISGLGPDVGIHAVDNATAALLLAGRDSGVRVAIPDAVGQMLEIARRFAEIRGKSWRVRELEDTAALLDGLRPTAPAGKTWPAQSRPPVGWIEQNDGRIALGAAIPLGVLDAEVARYLAAVEAPITVTPWRSVVLFDLDEGVADVALRVLAPLGLVFDEDSAWLSLSACTGSPGCSHSVADVRADAAAALDTDVSVHRHFVGCDRACGSPPIGQVLVATADGYQVRGNSPVG